MVKKTVAQEIEDMLLTRYNYVKLNIERNDNKASLQYWETQLIVIEQELAKIGELTK